MSLFKHYTASDRGRINSTRQTYLQQERVGRGEIGSLVELVVQQTRFGLLHGDALTGQTIFVGLARRGAITHAEAQCVGVTDCAHTYGTA